MIKREIHKEIAHFQLSASEKKIHEKSFNSRRRSEVVKELIKSK